MAAWLPEGVTGAVKLDGNGLKVDAEFSGRGEVSTAALDSLKIVAFDLAALHMAVEEKADLPAFLVHDSPREADLDGQLYAGLFKLLHQWEEKATVPCFQYIVTTTTAPPPELQSDRYVRLQNEFDSGRAAPICNGYLSLTMTIESPQSFVVREECQKAASQNGFRRILGEEAGWSAFGSTTAHGTIHLAASGPQGPWFVALDHPGVLQELNLATAGVSGPGRARFALDTLGALYAVLHRVYELGVSLPDAPLREFERRTMGLPRTTEAERLVVQRIGQDIFRDRLMDYWQGRCPLTGISDTALLRASHIVPWVDCEADAERLDVHNGLLLSALWDAAFDRALVTFDDQGRPQLSSSLSEQARAEFRWHAPIPLTNEHRRRLTHHRERARFQS